MKKRRLFSTLFLPTMFLCGCAQHPSNNPSPRAAGTTVPTVGHAGKTNPESRIPDQRLIEGAILEDLAPGSGRNSKPDAEVIFIQVAPDDVQYFSSQYPSPHFRVVSKNPIYLGEARMIDGDLVDTKLNKPSVDISIRVEKINSPAAFASVGFVYADQGGAFFEYELRFNKGKWKVSNRKPVGAF